MDYGYNNLEVAMEQVGKIATILEDDTFVINWLKNAFPFHEGGSIDWTIVPSTMAASVTDHNNVRELDAAFKTMVHHVGGYEDEEIFVLWRDGALPTVSMPLWACRKTLRWLVHASPDTFVISLDGEWCLEVDFHDHIYGARAE